MKGLLVVLVVVVIAALGIVFWEAQPVTISYQHRVVCSDSRHAGDPVISSKGMTRTVARYSRATVHDDEETTVCQVCQDRRERERRAEQERRAREAREAREREQRSRLVGRWVWNANICVIELILNSNGTGRLDYGRFLSWQPSEHGFRGIVEYPSASGNHELHRIEITGALYDNGRKVTIHGYGFFGFGTNESSEFTRAN